MTCKNSPNSWNQVVCPSCNNRSPQSLGRIPRARVFAGVVVDVPLPGGSLYECSECCLSFRWPSPGKNALDRLYEKADSGHWRSVVDRRNDWSIARRYMSAMAKGPDVLDVGCWDGRFLKSLDAEWVSYGIEINAQAASHASSAGIEIIASNFDQLDSHRKYDVVVSFDVLEHARNPLEFLDRLKSATRSGGLIIVGTGNTDSLPWRLHGASYLYCVNPEHVSFINRKWCEFAATRLELKLAGCQLLNRAGHHSLLRKASDLFANLLFSISPDAISFLRRVGFGDARATDLYPDGPIHPSWYSAVDHLIAVFRRG